MNDTEKRTSGLLPFTRASASPTDELIAGHRAGEAVIAHIRTGTAHPDELSAVVAGGPSDLYRRALLRVVQKSIEQAAGLR